LWSADHTLRNAGLGDSGDISGLVENAGLGLARL